MNDNELDGITVSTASVKLPKGLQAGSCGMVLLSPDMLKTVGGGYNVVAPGLSVTLADEDGK
jgi:hypothetical protein